MEMSIMIHMCSQLMVVLFFITTCLRDLAFAVLIHVLLSYRCFCLIFVGFLVLIGWLGFFVFTGLTEVLPPARGIVGLDVVGLDDGRAVVGLAVIGRADGEAVGLPVVGLADGVAVVGVAVVGLADGEAVGLLVVGLADGVAVVGVALVGLADGETVGLLVVGLADGVAVVGVAVVGLADGDAEVGVAVVGLADGVGVGTAVVGLADGDAVDTEDGVAVAGDGVGLHVIDGWQLHGRVCSFAWKQAEYPLQQEFKVEEIAPAAPLPACLHAL
jgi:hypothetical protein